MEVDLVKLSAVVLDFSYENSIINPLGCMHLHGHVNFSIDHRKDSLSELFLI